MGQVRGKEADIDAQIAPIEDMYSLLLRYEVRVPKEETGMVSDLRYGWKKLRKLATDTSDNLARVQVSSCLEMIGTALRLQVVAADCGCLRLSHALKLSRKAAHSHLD